MATWVVVGDRVLNVDNIEYIERKNTNCIIVYMVSGKIIELTNTVALTLWKYLDGERLKFLDLENPTRDFSGT
jgi:hypothetical protein